MSTPISDDIRAQIVVDYQTGMTQHAVAAKHGVGPASVNRIVHAAGAERGRKFTADTLDEAVQDYLDSGDSIRVVSTRHPLSEETLRHELHRREVTRPSGATTATTTRTAALEDYLDGMNIARIAAKYDVSRSTISAWIKADGLTPEDRQRGESPFDYTHGWVRDGLVWRPVKTIRERAA